MTEQPESSESDTARAAVAARLAMIQSRVDQPLSDAEMAEVTQRIARSMALGAALRAYPLENHDAPEIALLPYRGGAQ